MSHPPSGVARSLRKSSLTVRGDLRRCRPGAARRSHPPRDLRAARSTPELSRRAGPTAAGQPAGRVPTPARAQRRRPGCRPSRRHAPDLPAQPGWSRRPARLPGPHLGRRAHGFSEGRRGGPRRQRTGATMSTQTIPTVWRTITVDAPVERAFRVFTESFNSWWPPEHHIGEAELAEAVLEPREGGRWYERGIDGSECEWGRVLAWEPPHRLVVTWQTNGEWQYDPDPRRASAVSQFWVFTCSRVTLPRRTFSRIDSAVAVQTNGFGSSLCACRYSSIAAISSGTLRNTPRRIALSVRSRNHRSTRFNHDEEVGLKCRWKRGRLASHALTLSWLWVPELSTIRCTARCLGTARSMVRRNRRNSPLRCRGRHWPITLPVSTSSAANSVVRRVEVQPDDIDQLLLEPAVVGQLERLHPVGLQPPRGPDPLHRRRGDPGHGGHRAATPVGVPRRLAVQRQINHLSDLLRRDRRLTAPTLAHLTEVDQPPLREVRPPRQHRRPGHPSQLGDLHIGHPISGQQQHPRPGHHPKRQRLRPGQRVQHLALPVGYFQRVSGTTHEPQATNVQHYLRDTTLAPRIRALFAIGTTLGRRSRARTVDSGRCDADGSGVREPLCLPEISSGQVRRHVRTRAGCRRDDRVGGCRGGRAGRVRDRFG